MKCRTKNVVFTILFAGILGPSLLVWLEGSVLHDSKFSNHLGIFIYVLPVSLVGMIYWLLIFWRDKNRLVTGLVCIGVALALVFSSAPVVMKI